MGLLILVRHGQASLGAADYDVLSDLGRLQARATGARLAAADLAVERVLCGSLVRQRDTAVEVAAALGLAAERQGTDDRLDEYDNTGMTNARSVTFAKPTTTESRRAQQAAVDQAIARWMAAGDDGTYPESHAAFVGRVRTVLGELTGASGTTVAVSSAGVIATACALALGLPVERWPDLARIVLNASITRLISGRTGTHLLTFNDHAHLEHDRSLVTYR
jgi:broad specificity phosphatase PhoE